VGHASKALVTVLLGAGLLSVWTPASPVLAGNSVVTVDSDRNVGENTSMVLDGAGNPVVSYYDDTNGALKLVHCNDASCAGGGESLVTVDNAGDVGGDTSLVLDDAGNPVISYYDWSNRDLKLVHCNDPSCAGGGQSIVTVDSAGNVGGYTSLVLDGAGNPVVSYLDITNGDLKLVHCHDPSCADGGQSIVTVDSAGFVGGFTSLVLDAAGNPVVSYYDGSNGDLKLVHCNDPGCAGSDESLVTVDSDGDVGWFTSLVLDGAGNPVVSYYDDTNGDLKLVHCHDANCAGGDESIVAVDRSRGVGWFTSLVLDGAGNPVVSYYDDSNGDLKLVHCHDANCAGGGESIVAVDSDGFVGRFTSLVLDGAGNPVVSYHDFSRRDLKVAHCDWAACVDVVPPVTSIGTDPGTPDGANGWYRSAVTVSASAIDDEGVIETRCALDPVATPVSFHELPAGPCESLVVAVDGEHTVYAGSVDAAGNTDVVQASLRIDRIAPETSIGADPDGVNGWYRSAVTVSASATDDNGVVETRCALDPVVAPVSFDDLPAGPCESFIVADNGEHTVYAGSVDTAGNTDLVQASLRIDRTAPVTSIGTDPGSPDGANGWYRSAVSVTVTATDDEGVVETRCALDPVAVPVYFHDLPAGPCAIGTVAVDGEHTVYAGSVDAAGNTDLVQVAFRIDRTAPRASIRLNPAVPDGARSWYVDPVTVSVTADGPGATLRCELDPVSAPTSFGQLPNRPCTTFTISRYGHHRVYAAAADPAGNTGPVAATAFKSVGALRCDGQVPTHIGTPGADVIVGTPRADVIVALGGNDVIRGRGGNDLICAGAGDDRVYGGSGNDRIYGGRGNDTLHGSDGHDLLFGGAGTDTLDGGRNNDALFGGLGDDTLHGGPGDDVLDGGAGTDTLHGGPGHDRSIGASKTDTNTAAHDTAAPR
jgi:hypothetical protein